MLTIDKLQQALENARNTYLNDKNNSTEWVVDPSTVIEYNSTRNAIVLHYEDGSYCEVSIKFSLGK